MAKLLKLLTLIIAFGLNTKIMAQVIQDFTKDNKLTNWFIVNDDVMGGISSCNFYIDKNGYAIFKGTISTAYNGGFASIRYNAYDIQTKNKSFIELLLKGDNKKYQLRIKANNRDYQSYVFSFETSDEWETITIPIKEMYASFRGRRLNMKNFDGSSISQISILAGNKKNEDFELKIKEISIK